jgi:type VI protein secretion system component Hcp
MITKYFLLIDGLNGGSTDEAHKGWFEINGFDLDIGSASDGSRTFSPLKVDMLLDGALTGLLADSATGHVIKSIKLEGVVVGSAGETPVYDLTLADVVVRQLHDEAGGVPSETFAEPSSQVDLVPLISVCPVAGVGISAGALRRRGCLTQTSDRIPVRR